jgi:hypothetical protein
MQRGDCSTGAMRTKASTDRARSMDVDARSAPKTFTAAATPTAVAIVAK